MNPEEKKKIKALKAEIKSMKKENKKIFGETERKKDKKNG